MSGSKFLIDRDIFLDGDSMHAMDAGFSTAGVAFFLVLCYLAFSLFTIVLSACV